MNNRMMNKKAYRYLFLPLLFCLCFAFVIKTYAESYERDVYYVDQDGRSFYIAVIFANEQDKTGIKLKGPDDKYRKLDSKTITTINEKNYIYILVENADQGQWKLVFDRDPGDKVEIKAYADEAPITVDSVNVGTPDAENKVPVSFKVSQEDERNYSYEIRLGADESMGEYRVLATGSSEAGKEVSESVSFADVNTYDSYYIQVYVHYEKDGIPNFDMRTSAAFAYTNPDGDAPLIEDYNLRVEIDNAQIVADVAGHTGDVKAYSVKLTEDGTAGEAQAFDLAENGEQAYVSFKPETQVLTCDLTIMHGNGRTSAPLTKTAYLVPQQGVTFVSVPASGPLTSDVLNLEYENASNLVVKIERTDGKDVPEFTLNGTGVRQLKLGEFPMEADISYTTPDNITYVYHRIYSLDDIPPTLKIYEALDGTVTKNSHIVVTGKTDADAVLTVNGAETAKNANGSFSVELDLANGKNSYTIEASDTAGNTSSYVFTVTYSKDGSVPEEVLEEETGNVKTHFTAKLSKWLWLVGICMLVVYVLFLVIFVLNGKKSRSGRDNLRRAALVTAICSGVYGVADLVFYILRRHYEKSADYIDLAVNRLEDASKYLKMTKLCRIFLIIFAVMFVLSVAVLVISKKRVNAPQKKTMQKVQRPARANKNFDPYAQQSVQQPMQQPVQQQVQQPVQAEQQTIQEETTQQMKFCKYCGNQIKASASFCKKCGKKL